MTPRKYLMISALSKQMMEVKETAKKEADKFNIEHPVMWACDEKTEYKGNGYYGGSRELVGYTIKKRIPEDIAQEVLKFYKELQTMKADEIYAAVLKKLLKEAEDEDDGEGKK